MRSSTEKVNDLPRGASDLLHWLRALFAFLVLISHARGHLLVEYAGLVEPSMAVRLGYFMTGFGSASVIGFFVLSGFLITLRYFEPVRQGGVSPFRFLAGRAVRLYVVFLPVLLFSSLVVRLSEVEGDISFRTLLENALFLQPSRVPYFAHNEPLWSLGFEAWCYVAFCGLTAAVGKLKRREFGLGAFWGSVGVFPFLAFPPAMLHYFALWALGAGAALALHRQTDGEKVRVWKQRLRYPSLLLSLGGFLAARLGSPAPLRDYLVAFPLAVSLALLPQFRLNFSPTLARAGRFVSEMSYSLYLTHYMWVVVAESKWGGARQPSAQSLSQVAIVSLGSVVFAFVFSLVSERHTGKVRGWLRV